MLLRKVRGQIILIWDGSPIHRGQPVKDFLRRGAAKRLHLEQLPGYAPDLNPDEGVWNYVKRVELANICCRDLSELRIHVIRARERLRHKWEIIRACSRHCGDTLSFPMEREIRRWTRAGDTITLVRLSRARFWVWERWSPSSQKLFRNGCLSVLSGRLRVLRRRNEPTEDTAGWSQRPRRHRESGEDEGRQDDGAQLIETS